MQSDVFYPGPCETPSARNDRERAAKRVCASCAVRVECLAYALRSNEQLGVWGGMTENERRDLVADFAVTASP
jgi:WhiB family redox-sensing transcriptional regulator